MERTTTAYRTSRRSFAPPTEGTAAPGRDDVRQIEARNGDASLTIDYGRGDGALARIAGDGLPSVLSAIFG